MQKAAELYFIQYKTQTEIAQILNISIPTVSRLIKRARSEHVVQFSISSPFAECIQLEKLLQEKYGLDEVLVAPVKENCMDSEAVKQTVALEGARYLQRVTTPDDVLGIAWGGTMYYLVQYLNPCQRIDTPFVTLHGSLSCCDYELNVSNLVSRMEMAFGGNCYALTYPALMNSRKQVKSLLYNSRVRQILSLFKNITISVSGIGSFYPNPTSPLSRIQYLKPDEFSQLRENGVYGDLMLHFFDKNGCECDNKLKDRTLTIDLDLYRKIPHKVVVASGKHKAYTVHAALRGELVNVLIVDQTLARAISNL